LTPLQGTRTFFQKISNTFTLRRSRDGWLSSFILPEEFHNTPSDSNCCNPAQRGPGGALIPWGCCSRRSQFSFRFVLFFFSCLFLLEDTCIQTIRRRPSHTPCTYEAINQQDYLFPPSYVASIELCVETSGSVLPLSVLQFGAIGFLKLWDCSFVAHFFIA
jgi:hypothetical protein